MNEQKERVQSSGRAKTLRFSTKESIVGITRMTGLTALLIFVLSIMASVCHGQMTTATVTGEITDSSGAAVNEATVKMTNVNTGIAAIGQTSNDGRYRLSGLEPGVYKAEISKSGFKSILKEDIQLHIRDVAAINYSMQVGAVTESVTIEAGAPVIETQSTALGSTIEGRQVQDAPLNGRNTMNLISLVPGVVPQGSTSGPAAFNQTNNTNYTPAASGNYQISGAIAGWNATFIDGANVNAASSNQQALVPTQDSTSEFRVDTNAVSAQYGRFAGGVINFSTRSGTNDFHGTLYEYLRNTIFNANNFYYSPTRLNSPTPILHMNQYGATLGGPIKRNKAFFFFGWEEFRSAVSTLISSRVPTPAEMAGDFRASGPTWDPKTNARANGCGSGPLDTFCSSELDPTAQAFYVAKPRPYWQTIESDPARLATLMSNGYNVSVNGKKNLPATQYVARGDFQLTQKQHLFARYTYWDIFVSTTYPVTAPAFPGGPVQVSVNQGVVGDDYAITPTLFANIRLAYIRYMYNNLGAGDGKYNMAQFGSNWAAIGNQLPFKAPPNVIRTSWANAPSPAIDIDIHNFNNNYSGSLGMTKVQGKHTIMFGGEYRRIETYGSNSQSPGGSLYFAGYADHIASDGVTRLVNRGIANLVEGLITSNPSGGILTNVTRPSAYNFYEGLYITDTWQMKSNFTLNAGVRWEQPGSWMERHDKTSVLLPDHPNPLGSFANPVPGGPTTLMGEIVPVATADYPSRKMTEMHLHLFEPRVGLAYAVSPNTVLRGGFALAHPCLECMSATTLPQNSPLNAATTQIQVPSGGYTSLSNPFPSGIFQPTGRTTQIMAPYSVYPQTLIGATVSGQIPTGTFSYVMQWNANLQQALGASTSFMISYSGNRGVHLGAFDINLNQLPDQYHSLGNTLLNKVNNPLKGIASPAGNVGAATANYGQFLMPFPQFTRLTAAGLNYGESTYHALITSFRKRFGSSFANVAYTWSHTLANIDGTTGNLDAGSGQGGSGVQVQDFTNLKAERSNSAEDIRQRLVLEYVLDVPMGKGRRFFSTANPIVDHIISGWGLNGITTLQSGLPIALSTSSTNALTSQFGAGTLRPNVVPGVPKQGTGTRYERTLPGRKWFNTAAFAAPGNFQFGNESRVDSELRNDSVKNWDMGLTKTTKIRERFSIQFRAEYFNVFNRPQFGMAGQANTQVGNANFGNFDTQANSPRAGQFSLRLNY